MYVTTKFLPAAAGNLFPLGLEILNSILNYVIFLPALLLSHVVFVLGLTGVITVTIPGAFTVLWVISFLAYVALIWFALRQEGERHASIYALAVLSYFTYAQCFIPVVVRAMYLMMKENLLGQEIRWAKTARSKES